MLRFGIFTPEQFQGERRRFFGPRVAYSLLDVGDHPTAEQIRTFEDVSFKLRTSNGTFRTTFRNRFHDVDALALTAISASYPPDTQLHIQDRAVSHGLTSWEWARELLAVYPRAEFEASDLLLHLFKLTLPSGEIYILEPDGKPLQYIKPPFVVSLQHREAWRYPVNHAVAALARRRFKQLNLPEGPPERWPQLSYTVSKIPFVHPEARLFAANNTRFQFRVRSVFEHTPDACHVLRTMNIFNEGYFSDEQLSEGAIAAFHSVKRGGIWIVGRTLEEDLSNHVTFFRRQGAGWEVLERIGNGSEIEQLAIRHTISASASSH